MNFHIWAELLSCWLHSRRTLPHIYRVSDYFWIKIRRDWTIAWRGQQCFDTPGICNTVLVNSQLCNIGHDSVYGSRISLLQLLNGKLKTLLILSLSPETTVRRSSPERENQTPPPSSSPWTKFCCTIAWKSTPASTRALEIWADCWKWTLSAGRKKKQSSKSSSSLILEGWERHKKKGTIWSSRTQHPI